MTGPGGEDDAGSLADGSGLHADLRVRRPGFALDVELHAAPGEVVALLGPNGAGKTTALRVLAGLQPADGGGVRLDGVALHRLPPERRRVGLVPQDALLLPHLSALDNVAYGLRARGARRASAHARAAQELARVGLADRGAARPRQLSGGQAARVALARALATDPALLLLDEPLAALDALVRTDVRTDLRRRMREFPGPAVVVTHDLVDALVLADRLVVLEDGRVVQSGAPAQVVAAPRTAYVAGLAGLVLLRACVGAGRAVVDGQLLATTDLPDGPALLAFPPEAVELHDVDVPGGWPVVVRALEQRGTSTSVVLEGRPALSALVRVARAGPLGLHVGRRLWARVPAQEVTVYR